MPTDPGNGGREALVRCEELVIGRGGLGIPPPIDSSSSAAPSWRSWAATAPARPRGSRRSSRHPPSASVTSSPGVARPAGAFLRPFGAAGAGDLGGRAFRDLSKGEKQRVLLARLLVTDADLVLLDEPTAPMDARGEREALRRLSEMACERRKAVVVVSHAPRVVSEHATRVLLLDRDDALVLHGSPAEVMAHDAYRRELGQAEARDGG